MRPSPIQLSKLKARRHLCPLSVSDAHIRAQARIRREWEGEYVESLPVISVKYGLGALSSNSPKTCYSSFCFLSLPLAPFVSKFLFISSSLILPGVSGMLFPFFFSRAFRDNWRSRLVKLSPGAPQGQFHCNGCS